MPATRGIQKNYLLLSGNGTGRQNQAREQQLQQIRDDEAFAKQLLAHYEREERDHQRKQSLKADELEAKLQFLSAGPKWNPVEGTRQSCKPNYFKVHSSSRASQVHKKRKAKQVAVVVSDAMDMPEGLEEESDQGKGLHIPCPSSSANAKKKTGLWAAAISSNNQYGSSSLQIQAAQLASRREWEEKQRREAELKRTVIAENHRAVAAGGWGVPGPQTGQTVNSLGA